LATFSGSAQSMELGRPVFTPQNPQDLVQMFPRIIKVAVPSPQHSAILGQLPEEQIVLSLYLSTNVLKFEYFLPVGNLTLIHLGLDELILGTDDFVSIFISDDIKAFFYKDKL
jgi:hypothetical protein